MCLEEREPTAPVESATTCPLLWKWNVEPALPRILENLLERGYRFGTIDRLGRLS